MVLNIVTLVACLSRKIKPLALTGMLLPLTFALMTGIVQAQGVSIPNFWDPRTQLERPEIPATRTIRFLVDDDFPPLHFPGLDGNPTGLSVELARAACER